MSFWVPNKMIPLNDREPGKIAEIAKQQLRRYQNAADTWPLVEHKHDYRLGYCCRTCDKTIYFTQDREENPYHYEQSEIRALIVAHIRQCHADIIDENGEIISENARKSQVLDSPSNDYPLGKHRGNANRPDDQSGDSRGIEYT